MLPKEKVNSVQQQCSVEDAYKLRMQAVERYSAAEKSVTGPIAPESVLAHLQCQDEK